MADRTPSVTAETAEASGVDTSSTRHAGGRGDAWTLADELIRLATTTASPAVVAALVRAAVSRTAASTLVRVHRGKDLGVVITAGGIQAHISPGSVSVLIGPRRGFALGDTTALLEALPPPVAGGRVRVPHDMLAALPREATGLTAAIATHVEALLDVAGDDSVIPDEALADAVGCSVAAVKKHR